MMMMHDKTCLNCKKQLSNTMIRCCCPLGCLLLLGVFVVAAVASTWSSTCGHHNCSAPIHTPELDWFDNSFVQRNRGHFGTVHHDIAPQQCCVQESFQWKVTGSNLNGQTQSLRSEPSTLAGNEQALNARRHGTLTPCEFCPRDDPHAQLQSKCQVTRLHTVATEDSDTQSTLCMHGLCEFHGHLHIGFYLGRSHVGSNDSDYKITKASVDVHRGEHP